MLKKTTGRLEIIKSKLLLEKVDAFLITNLVNVKYLSGFAGSNGYLFLCPEDQYFITDSRYLWQAEKEIKDYKILEQKNSLSEVIKNLVETKKIKYLGIEGDVSYKIYNSLQDKLSEVKLVIIEKVIEEARLRKDEEEVKNIKRACQEIQLTLIKVLKLAKEGVREVEIAAEIEYFLKKKGMNSAFETIVASGVSSSYPHAKASLSKIKKDDLLLIDAGAVFNGYHSDITRTIILGRISKEKKKIYEVVKGAQEYALSLVKVGLRCSDLDREVRKYIDDKGYGQYFIHNLGHGVGLEVHEDPVLSQKTKNGVVIDEGMVFTIEPGIYIPGLGGVRIENVILAKKEGCEVLTNGLPLEIILE
ncbi:Xaa-Pro peptidase family protein [bacterium]|nr:Xaa-Pro peptidase family protein [bacterium]MBU1152601.1 Xaa-Pro peptidase family protein [bacterium]MBU2600293.1 Xaa-Pro peptidase family protein [bacterium]